MLRDIQARLADAIIDGDAAAADIIVDDAPGAAGRLAIYSNHFRISLIEALAATFPVVFRLVGEAFFRAAARRFVTTSPPRQPRLFAYGEDFPGFLAALPEAAAVPYLADQARLDWAINAAWHAPDPEAAADRLVFHPALSLVVSPFPIDRIWRANQEPPLDDPATIDLDAGGVRLLVNRQDGQVGWIGLAEPDGAFIGALLAGQDIGSACAAAAGEGFDPAPLLAALLDAGLVLAPGG